MPSSRHSWVWFIPFALVFSLQVVPRFAQDSPAGDESIDIADGYYYWKGDVLSTAEHPPLAKALQALPLWVLGAKSHSKGSFTAYEQRDWHFLFVLNRDRWPLFFELARSVSWLFGLGTGFLLFWIARQESTVFLLCVLGFWAFDPTLLAFSGLAMADGPLGFFVLAAVWLFQRTLEKSSPRIALKTGGLAAMAVTAKFTAGLLIPIFGILEVLKNSRKGTNSWNGAVFLSRWGWMGAVAGVWIFLIYLPGTISIPAHRWPFYYFGEGLMSIAYSTRHWVYFRSALTEHNCWDYYPAVFFLKTPLALLFLLAVSAGLALKREIQIPFWQWIPPLFFFAALAPFHDIGVRMLLPIYPFCFLIAARAGEWMWGRRPGGSRVFPILLCGLLAFQALSVGLCFPSQISYFNELVPQNRKLYWLGDSNLDIGQDTKRMAEEARRKGWTHVKLAYLGIADPAWYGMKWSPWTQRDLRGPRPGWVYAVNAEFLQLGPAYNKVAPLILGSWMGKTSPTGRVGDTWYYFEVPGTPVPDHSPALPSTPFLVQHYDGDH